MNRSGGKLSFNDEMNSLASCPITDEVYELSNGEVFLLK